VVLPRESLRLARSIPLLERPKSEYTQHFYRAAWNAEAVYSDEKAVCPFVRPSVNACIVTKGKKSLSRFLYHTKDHLAYFSAKKNGWWEATTST